MFRFLLLPNRQALLHVQPLRLFTHSSGHTLFAPRTETPEVSGEVWNNGGPAQIMPFQFKQRKVWKELVSIWKSIHQNDRCWFTCWVGPNSRKSIKKSWSPSKKQFKMSVSSSLTIVQNLSKDPSPNLKIIPTEKKNIPNCQKIHPQHPNTTIFRLCSCCKRSNSCSTSSSALAQASAGATEASKRAWAAWRRGDRGPKFCWQSYIPMDMPWISYLWKCIPSYHRCCPSYYQWMVFEPPLRGLLVALHADQSCKYVRSRVKYPYVLCVLHGKKWYFINGLDAISYIIYISCHIYKYN